MINFTSDSREHFDRASPQTQADATPVLEFLSTGFDISWFLETSPRIWNAVIKPNPKVRAQFALNLEYFLIGHGFERDFHQTTLLAEPPAALAFRLDSRIRFVASPAPLMKAACAAWAAEHKLSIIPIDAKDASQIDIALEGETDLFELLSNSLWRRDLFDDSEPIRVASEFFGRELAVQELSAKALLGQPVAVFGLRKIGKSSLLRRVQELLESSSNPLIFTAFVQCNATRIKAGRWWLLLADLIDHWQSSLLEHAKRIDDKIRPQGVTALSGLQSQGKHLGDASKVASAFSKDFNKLLKTARALQEKSGSSDVRLVAFFDEADEIYPNLPTSGYWKEEYFTLWNTLQTLKRGLDAPAQLAYILGGVNPAGVERGSLLEQSNPLFEVSKLYLPPMSPKESASLLRGLGSRMGLTFDQGAVEKAHSTVGGHPWLLRKLGSKIHNANKDRGAARPITANEVDKVFHRSKRDFHAHIDWILNHLKDVAPDEYRLLRDIAVGGKDRYLKEWADKSFRETFAEHLNQYGLVSFEDDLPQISLSLIADALHQPAANEFAEQKQRLREAVDLLEDSIRSRLAHDLTRERSINEAVDAIVDAIPKGDKNRPFDREKLRSLGYSAGITALIEALNWGDYQILCDKHYESIQWSGPQMDRQAFLGTLGKTFEFIHLVRHKNHAELAKKLAAEGFDPLYKRILEVHEAFSG